MSQEPDRPADPPEAPVPIEITSPPQRRPSLLMRVVLLVVGWALIALGILGLALPGLQGILTLVAGAAILSVASDTVHQIVRRQLERWPGIHERFEKVREKLHDRFSRH